MPDTHDAFGMLLQRQNDLFAEMKDQEAAIREIRDMVARIEERLTDYKDIRDKISKLEAARAQLLGWAMGVALVVSLLARGAWDFFKSMMTTP